MDGRGHLDRLIADHLSGAPGAFNRSELRGVAFGLVAAQALAQADADRMLADLDAELRRIGRLRSTHVSQSTTASAPMAVRIGAEPPHQPAAKELPVPVLRHVVPLVGRHLTVGEARVVLVSLEVWSSFLVLNLAHVGVDMPQRFGTTIRWRGWDDVGTQYRSVGSGASGMHGLVAERQRFGPSAPAAARTLTLVVEYPDGRADISIPLP